MYIYLLNTLSTIELITTIVQYEFDLIYCFIIVFVITKPITYVGLLRLLMAFVRFMTQRNLKVFNRSYGWRKI